MVLRAHDITVRLGRREILHGIDLDVQPGEVLALIGPNGAGKSTLFRALSGELEPSSGSALLDGRTLSDWDRRKLATRIAVLPQSPTLSFSFTIEQVVELGRYPHAARKAVDIDVVNRCLTFTDLLSRRDTPWTRLSGGEQQRVMLARALAQLGEQGAAARYLLLDEPTSALDLNWQQRVLRLARDLASANVGVLIVLHDLVLASTFADRVALLHRGRLEAIGAPREVLTPDRLAACFGVHARWVHVPEHGDVPVITGTR